MKIHLIKFGLGSVVLALVVGFFNLLSYLTGATAEFLFCATTVLLTLVGSVVGIAFAIGHVIHEWWDDRKYY